MDRALATSARRRGVRPRPKLVEGAWAAAAAAPRERAAQQSVRLLLAPSREAAAELVLEVAREPAPEQAEEVLVAVSVLWPALLRAEPRAASLEERLPAVAEQL